MEFQRNNKEGDPFSAFIDKSVDEFIETIGKDGFIIVNGECSYGVLFIIKNNNICMSGKK